MSKKYLLALLFCGGIMFARAAQAESISSFNSNIHIQTDGSIIVQETIQYDFDNLQRHGIYRNIDLRSAGVSSKLIIDQITVDNGQGQDWPFQLSQTGNQLQVKIGSAAETVTGLQTYHIQYRAQNALGSFADHDELYWNVTGNRWEVPIQQASAQISLPSSQPSGSLSLYCYTGATGSTTKCQQAQLALAEGDTSRTADFSQNVVSAGEGLTVALGWPKGLTTIEPVKEEVSFNYTFSPAVLQNIIVAFALPFIALIVMLAWWWSRGRGPRARGAIVPQYEPLIDLTPSETAIIYKSSMSSSAVAAELIEAARTGYVKITHSKQVIQFAPDKDEFTLERLKDFADLPLGFRRSLLETIFAERSWLEQNLPGLSLNGFVSLIAKARKLTSKPTLPINEAVSGLRTKITLSELEASFFIKKNINLLLLQPQEQLIQRGYYQRKTVSWFAPFLATFIIGFALVNIFLHDTPLLQYSLMVSLCIVIIFLSLRSTLSQKGVEARQYVLGLKMYLGVAEKDRLEFHNAPEKNSETFEKLLPYAIALGVDKQWAEQFKSLTLPQPNWYSDSSGGAFNAIVLTNSLHNFSSSLASSTSLGGTSGSGGGGSSGGGGGGGGGGSW